MRNALCTLAALATIGFAAPLLRAGELPVDGTVPVTNALFTQNDGVQIQNAAYGYRYGYRYPSYRYSYRYPSYSYGYRYPSYNYGYRSPSYGYRSYYPSYGYYNSPRYGYGYRSGYPYGGRGLSFGFRF